MHIELRKGGPGDPDPDDPSPDDQHPGLGGATDEDARTRGLKRPRPWLRCVACGAPITRVDDACSIPPHGPVASFVNPGGFVHEVVTFGDAPGAAWTGARIPADSWFPGYTWRFGVCGVCKVFVGWYYEASANATPARFWGLRRGAVKLG
mgnify:CR=1 FL=1